MNEVLYEQRLPGGRRLQIVQGDLTEEQVDAIVNAANSRLQHGGGVAAAISRRGGPQIQQESDRWVRENGPAAPDKPAYTGPGKLPCKVVIHAVGPIWGEGDEDRKLETAITSCLALAEDLKLTSIAFPAISTGIFGFPKEQAAQIFYSVLQRYFAETPDLRLELVRLTLFDQPSVDVFLKVWKEAGDPEP